MRGKEIPKLDLSSIVANQRGARVFRKISFIFLLLALCASLGAGQVVAENLEDSQQAEVCSGAFIDDLGLTLEKDAKE